MHKLDLVISDSPAPPTAIEALIKRQYGVHLVGRIPDVLDKFHAISAEKRVHHAATLLVVKQARNKVFEAR